MYYLKNKHDEGIELEDGRSKLQLERLEKGNDKAWRVIMHEGRNRQVRRTFTALGYQVSRLHRIAFGDFEIGDLAAGGYSSLSVL
jgi:23S rRNA pseudouridine2605 synthase